MGRYVSLVLESAARGKCNLRSANRKTKHVRGVNLRFLLMTLLKKDASSEFIDAVRQIEECADECFKALSLLKHPSNIAIWSLLVGGIRRIEQQISQHGDNSLHLQSALINLSRALPIAMKWAFDHGRRASKLTSRRLTSTLEAGVEAAIFVTHQYSHFLSGFPLWHKNVYAAELFSPTVLRFTLPGSAK